MTGAAMKYRMHTIMGGGFVGGQRFLPWHRVYAWKMEDLLRRKIPGVTIPYWDFANDRVRPDWVWKPAGVSRGTPGAPGDLPSQVTVDNLVNNAATFTTFANGVENDAHNSVHNWCNGTITDPMTATLDPIFWLLHANVDRIWDRWQSRHSGLPDLSGVDAVMDPWTETTIAANDIIKLGYVYQ
jgi:hypothetical protein